MAKELIPREFIHQLLSRIDIVDLVDGRVPLRKKSANNYFACCPFHTEKSASFSVSQQKQFYYCFGCGASGNAIDFLIQYDRLSFPEAVEALAKLAGLVVPTVTSLNSKPSISENTYELMLDIAKYYQSALRQSAAAIEYLKKRGVSGAIAKEFGIGFAPSGWDHVLQQFGKTDALKQQLFDAGMLIKKNEGGYYDRFRERIMFPIHDRRGRVIGFGGRIVESGEPKYLNSPETALFQKGHELYGLHHALQAHRQLNRVLIVEGYMDVVALFQHEIRYAVATLGTATTAHHLHRLFKYCSEIIFCFDGDQAGKTAAWRALLVLLPIAREDIQIRFMFLPDKEDPDSLVRKEGKTAFEQRMQSALPLSQFFFQHIGAQADLTNTDGRARFVKLATEHLKQLTPGIFQKMMFEELAKRARIDVDQLTAPPSTTASKPTPAPVQKARTPSSLRLAMTLLVQEPTLAHNITEKLPPLELNGYELLLTLLDTINTHAIQTTGGLLEHWRDNEQNTLISKLAQTEHMIPKDGITHEFLGAIANLRKMANKQIIENLLAKAAQDGLTQTEKHYLQTLIHDK